MENPIVVKIPGLIAFAVHEGINELRQLNLATTIYGKINSIYFYIENIIKLIGKMMSEEKGFWKTLMRLTWTTTGIIIFIACLILSLFIGVLGALASVIGIAIILIGIIKEHEQLEEMRIIIIDAIMKFLKLNGRV